MLYKGIFKVHQNKGKGTADSFLSHFLINAKLQKIRHTFLWVNKSRAYLSHLECLLLVIFDIV